MTAGPKVAAYFPITLSGIFVKSTLDSLRALYEGRWHHAGIRFDRADSFETAIRFLDPLTSPPSRFAGMTTKRRGWIAVYSNTLDLGGNMTGLGMNLGESIAFICHPGIPWRGDRGCWANFCFVHYRDGATRTIHLMQYRSKWRFAAQGEPIEIEDLEAYERPKLAERFSPRLVFEYLERLGLPALDDELFVVDRDQPALLVGHARDGDLAKSQAAWIAGTDWRAALAAQWDRVNPSRERSLR